MKRIKLFEAFSNGDKIEKVNFILFDWAVEAFIETSKSSFVYDKRHDEFNMYQEGGSTLIATYYPDDPLHRIIVIHKAYPFFVFFEDKEIINTRAVPVGYTFVGEVKARARIQSFLNEVLYQKLKKLYLDEKNKTI